MPVQAIIPAGMEASIDGTGHVVLTPNINIAGGVVIGRQIYQVGHQNGNVENKRRRALELLQGILDNKQNAFDLPTDDPHHPDNTPALNEYDDEWRRPDDSLIDELYFYYRQNPATLHIICRGILADIILEVENDPTLGGEDRYSLQLRRL